MEKKIQKIIKETKNKPEQKFSILSMGYIDLTFKIEFTDEDLEIKNINNTEKENKENNKENENKQKLFYNINDFHQLKDLDFLKERKNIWDKFQLIPNSTTLEHLLISNILPKGNIDIEYIGFGYPGFDEGEEFFEEIFEYIAKKNNIFFNKNPLSHYRKCKFKFEFSHNLNYNNFEIERDYGGRENELDKSKEKNIPNFSRKQSILANIRPEKSKYNLFYLNFEDLEDIPGDFKRIDLIELIYFLRKNGAKIFINFFKIEKEASEQEVKEEDNDIISEHFDANTPVNQSTEKEEELDEEEKGKQMKEMNNIYYLTDLFFYDIKQVPEEFNSHYNFFTVDKIKQPVNKGNIFDYFIKGIATGTQDHVDREKFGFFIEYFNKLNVIRVGKKEGNKY